MPLFCNFPVENFRGFSWRSEMLGCPARRRVPSGTGRFAFPDYCMSRLTATACCTAPLLAVIVML